MLEKKLKLELFICVFGVFVCTFSHFSACADICDEWFKQSKIKSGAQDCLLQCAIHKVDMSTFMCHDACGVLCKKAMPVDFTFKLSSLYPGLTDAERALVSEFPKQAFQVYMAKYKAESVCQDLFGQNQTNDESDACRHFVWAGLNTKELGSKDAQKFLNAHEQEPTQPEKEKAMDLANNRAGVLIAEELIKNNKFSIEELIQRFQKTLDAGELIVLKARIKK